VSTDTGTSSAAGAAPAAGATEERLPIRMLHDRVLVSTEGEQGERRSSSGIVIPATAQMGKRLSWATVVAVGANVRTVLVGDRVLFDGDDRAEVEVRGRDYVLLRERDVHAVAAERLDDGQDDGRATPGLYL
jgi:chaperonin GroES